MKKNLIIVVLALLVGGGLAYFVFKNSVHAEVAVKTTEAKAFQIGAFKTIENAERVAARNNGIVVMDKGIYRVYIAIIKNEDVVKKIDEYFDSLNLTYYVKDVNINEEYVEKLNTYEELIMKSSIDTYNTILINILNDYEEYYEFYD